MTETDGNILIAALDQRWREFCTQSKLCRHAFSEEAVHDLRVAARRLQAVLDLIRGLEPPPRVQRTRTFLKDRLDDLDDLRDVQVMLAELARTIQEIPELSLFLPYLQRRERRLLRTARKRIQTSRPSVHKKRMNQLRATLEKQAAQEGVALQMLRTGDNAYAKVRRAYEQIDGQAPTSIHKTRIAFKKFRYMVEVLKPLLPHPPESYFKSMHDYQSMMGDLRDTFIFLSTLADFAEDDPASIDIKSIRQHYEKRLAEMTAAFLKDKSALGAFWRAAPGQPFPWENSHDPLHHPPRNSESVGQQQPRTGG